VNRFLIHIKHDLFASAVTFIVAASTLLTVMRISLMLQRNLVATGDSPELEKVLEFGLKLAEKFSVEILLLHVLNSFQSSFETMGSPYMGGMYPITNDLAVQQCQKD
jgi:nucleotide-binding universal stress UspA family protein